MHVTWLVVFHPSASRERDTHYLIGLCRIHLCSVGEMLCDSVM